MNTYIVLESPRQIQYALPLLASQEQFRMLINKAQGVQ